MTALHMCKKCDFTNIKKKPRENLKSKLCKYILSKILTTCYAPLAKSKSFIYFHVEKGFVIAISE